MAVKPVTAPELPNTLVDLFGGKGTNPTALMSSTGDGEQILNQKPLADPLIKPSAEAAKALQLAQQQENAINQQAQRQQEALRKAQEAEQKVRAEAQKEVEKRLKAIRDEQNKVAKSIVDSQGGKVGANADGSFVSTGQVTKALEMKEWNEIMSSKQRWDEAERYIKDLGDTLKQQGVADDVIKNEQDNARKLFKTNIDAYVAKMNEDGTGLIDIAGRNIAKAAVGVAQGLALGVQGIGYLVKKGGEAVKEASTDELGLPRSRWVQEPGRDFQAFGQWLQGFGGRTVDGGDTINNWLDKTASDSLRLKMANSAYDEAKWDSENKTANLRDEGVSGIARSASASIGRMVDNGLVIDNVANFAAQLLGVGAAAKTGAKWAVKQAAKATAKEAAGVSVGLSTRILSGTVNTKYGLVNSIANLGRADRLATGAYGFSMTAMDAATGARSMVMNSSIETIKNNLGADVWDATVKQYGSEEKAKEALADDASWTAVKGISPVAVVTSMFGVESAMAGLFTKKAIIQAAEETAKGVTKKGFAKGAAKTALEGLSEGFEEGYTQYASNLGANPATGVDLQKGVGSAAGMGAFLGTFSAGAMNALSAMRGSDGKGFEQKMQDMMSDFVENGNLDLNAFRTEFENQIATHRANLARGGKVSPLEIKALTQRIYDMTVDGEYTITKSDGTTVTASPLSLMTAEQQAEFKQFAKQYGINTNAYRKAENSAWVNMFNNGDYNGVKQTEHEDLINAFRVRNNIDTDLIPPKRLAYAKAMARTIEYMNQQAQSVNTKQREEQFIRFRSDDLLNDETLTVDDLANLTAFSMDLLGANSARLSDQEQAQHNEQAGQNDPSQSQSGGQATSEQNVDGREQQASGQSNQEPTSGESTQSQGVGGTNERAERGDSSQGFRNDPTQQAPHTSGATDSTAQPSNGVSGYGQGVRQEQNAGQSQATATASNASEQTEGQGATRQTNESGQPVRQADPTTTQSPVSGGSTGATQTERNSDGGSPKTVAEVKREMVENGAKLTPEEAEAILNSKSKASNIPVFQAKEKTALTSERVKTYFANNGRPNVGKVDVAMHIAGLTNNEMNAFISTVFGDKKLKSINANHLRKVRQKLLEQHGAREYTRHKEEVLAPQREARRVEVERVRQETASKKAKEKELVNAQTAVTKADVAVERATKNADTARGKLATFLENYDKATKAIEQATSAVEQATEAVTQAEANLATAKSVVTTAKANVATKNKAFKSQSGKAKNSSAYKKAKGEKTAAETALTTANNARVQASTDLATKKADLTTATRAYNRAVNAEGMLRPKRIALEKVAADTQAILTNALQAKEQATNHLRQLTGEPEVTDLQPTNQETTNGEKQHLADSTEATSTETTNETRENSVGDTHPTDDKQGEISVSSGRENGTEQSQGGAETTTRPVGEKERATTQPQEEHSVYHIANLTVEEQATVAEIATEFETTIEEVYQAIVDGNIAFFTGRGETSGADVRTMAKEMETQGIVEKGEGADFIARLTTAPTQQVVKSGVSAITNYLNANRADKAKLDSYLASERSRLEAQINTAVDEALNNDGEIPGRAAQLSQELSALPKTAEKLVEENIVDDKLIPTNERKRSLPDSVNAVIDRIYKAIKNTVAAVSMLAAVATGVNLAVPQDVMAASNFETATVQHIVKTNDNQGKPIIVADKQAGTLTMYDAKGNELNSTPALFGKTAGDSISAKNTTPSGRYDLSYQTNINNKAYGNSAQVLSQNGKLQKNNAGHLAIHRVLTAFPKENRLGRLASEGGADNRISHGCINVPTSWYDSNLNGKSEAVVYVLPETTAGRTGIFANVVENTTQQATVETSPQANVSPTMDNANTQSVEVSAQEIEQATQQAEVVKEQPIQAKAPITIKGTQPSEQVAYVAPVVVGGVSVIQATVPTNVHTPAEQMADGSFDTQAISSQVRTDEGESVYDITTALTDILSGGLTVGGLALTGAAVGRVRRKRLESKKKRENAAQNAVDENHNNVARKNKARHVPDNLKAPPQKTKTQDAITRELWIEYLGTQFDNGQNNFVNEFADIMAGFDYSNLAILTDKSYQQSQDGSLDGGREWSVDITKKGRSGVREKLFSAFAGATPTFDKLMTKLGMPRFGHEADSTIPTVMLAQIKAKAAGAYSQIHKRYLNPLIQRTDKLAMELRKGYREVKQDAGRVATLRHILTEAADAMWKGYEKQITTLQQQIDAVTQELETTPADKAYSQKLINSLDEAKKALAKVQQEYDTTRRMYEGDLVWDGKTPLPGGYTREVAEKQLKDLQTKYGSDFEKIDNLANDIVETTHSVRIFASASGVFSTADLQLFEELGYKRYVPLYRDNVENPINEVEGEPTATTTSRIDDVWQDIPSSQAKSMGLTRDITRYRRNGATTHAADAFTNLEVFSINMSGRIGQQGWIDAIQQMYEGTVGKPISATQITNEETLAEINSQEESIHVPGLVRVLAGKDNYTERELKAKYKDIRPIVAKGYNAVGELKTYHYYFTDQAIQNEIYASMNMNETTLIKSLRNVATLTRYAARAMTTFKPVWNAYNWWRDSFERVSIMLMRPVKDQDGKLVNRWDMVKEYLKASSAMTFSLPAQNEIYRYLVTGEVKTHLQRTLHEAVGSGAINLMTAQTERHSVTADLKKSSVERLMKQVETALGTGLNKSGLGALKTGANHAADFYIARLTEVPQIITALASYQAYQNLGVNKRETQNRVRDQFDPLRASSAGVNTLGQLNPFVRSTLSGHYNLARSLTEYWKPGERKFTALYAVGSMLVSYAMMSLAGGIMGTGEDGEDLLSRIPLSTLLGGIPIKIGDSLWTVPVGFGWNKLMWGAAAIIYKLIHGDVTNSEAMGAVAGLVMDNTSPVTPASGSVVVDNPTAGVLLSATPLLLRPLVELATNTKSYGGQAIVRTKTPADQLNSEQDDFNTPDGYKAFAKWAYDTVGVDLRPEVVRHLVESYSFGPAGLVPKVLMQDRGDKYLGNTQSKGEHFGAILTAVGADIGVQPGAFDLTKQAYKLTDFRNTLHKKLGVGATHKADDYDERSTTGKRGGRNKPKAVEVTEQKLREKGVDNDTITYIVNGMRYETERKKLTKTFHDLSKKYQEARRNGTDTPDMRVKAQEAWDKLNDLTYNYVKENNSAYYKLLRK